MTPLQRVRYLEEARSVRRLAEEARLPEAQAAYRELEGWWRHLAERRTWQEEPQATRRIESARLN